MCMYKTVGLLAHDAVEVKSVNGSKKQLDKFMEEKSLEVYQRQRQTSMPHCWTMHSKSITASFTHFSP